MCIGHMTTAFIAHLDNCNDIISATIFRAETDQEEDPTELVEARNMALAIQGLFKNCTPTLAWNYHFGDMDAFYTERFAQVAAQNALVEPQHVSERRSSSNSNLD
ncbi:hypothetical protein BS50DRAFT_287616 [Corynespora cassiicola Philippines]|uniref:Uncharacterized protein n=1 Tax=Corynespora cassiicola Philippines TaxID=1448308 RepID=A0A2T2N100_CORCC|nr:hypothetical protein BS50DRAFT_287616 [Corynespora cassiicola Philippines]